MFKDRKGPCAFNKTAYEKDKDFFKCLSSVNVYHCIRDDRNKLGEICTQPIWVDPSNLIIFFSDRLSAILNLLT